MSFLRAPNRRKRRWAPLKGLLTSFPFFLAFSRKAAEAAIIFPTSSTRAVRGEDLVITWSGADGSTTVALRLLLNEGGEVLENIDPSAFNNGSYSWEVPSDTSQYPQGYYLVELDDGQSNATSEAFAISDALSLSAEVASADADRTIWSCGTNAVAWNSTGLL
ncbi:unnamed protein product, partial [Phaeothamnion confervicola]